MIHQAVQFVQHSGRHARPRVQVVDEECHRGGGVATVSATEFIQVAEPDTSVSGRLGQIAFDGRNDCVGGGLGPDQITKWPLPVS